MADHVPTFDDLYSIMMAAGDEKPNVSDEGELNALLPSANASEPGALDTSHSCGRINNLFGPDSIPVPLFGSTQAVASLKMAVEQDGHFILYESGQRPDKDFVLAYSHLYQKGIFPDPHLLQELYGKAKQDPDWDDWSDAPLPLAQGSPPFKSLKVREVLVFLRMIGQAYSRYCSEETIARPQIYTYNSGVVTLTKGVNEPPRFEAELFESRPGREATGTVWMYRQCAMRADGGYDEVWRAVGSKMAATAVAVPEQAVDSPLGSLVDGTQVENADVDWDTSPARTFHPLPPVQQPPRQQPPSDADLFNTDPDGIRGETILRLARSYTNTELFERINAGLASNHLPLIRESNVITRRITLAIQAKASSSESLTYHGVRQELNEARRVNGVKARSNERSRVTKERKRMEKRQEEEEEEEFRG
ncbi:hypothetical protein B0A50_06579 [Salinomyces thailandicus]|uniref:Uncharacterized protein n=1 Tax=Salinomyces thailandicus TaxID=706561 RepID=A0A4U0TRS6_9PEZI|nr:hypothetical protein B0A50_06579 [Salinomyces thailandica]